MARKAKASQSERERATAIATELGRNATSELDTFNRAAYVARCQVEGVDPNSIEHPQYAFFYGRNEVF